MSKSLQGTNDSSNSTDPLRQLAIESLLKESQKRKTLSEKLGSEAFYISRYSPAKPDIDFINRHIRRVNGHNKRWEEEKCYTIKKNIERLDHEDRKRRKRSKPVEDKYKAEKEYWKVEKAMKFSNREDKNDIINDLGVDRSNMLLFPTIASCTSSDEEPKERRHHHRHHHHRHHSHFIVY